MARYIYSHCFQRYGPTGASEYPTIIGGEGVVGVVRSMDFVAPTGGMNGLGGYRVDVKDFFGVGQGGLWFMGPGNCRQQRSYHWRGRAVMPFQSEVWTTTFDDGWSWNISGYLFQPTS